MRFSDYIQNTEIISTSNVLRLFPTPQQAYNALSHAETTGKVERVRNGLYVSNSGRFRGAFVNPLKIASNATDDAVLAYSSAFRLITGSQDASYDIPFFTAKRMSRFNFRGYEFIPYAAPASETLKRNYYLTDGTTLIATTKEQTIIDAVDAPWRCGGVEATLRRFSTIRYVDLKLLASLLADVSKSSIARLGWILEHMKSQWSVDDGFLDKINYAIGPGPYYFDRAKTRIDYDRRWKLYLPDTTLTIERWLHE